MSEVPQEPFPPIVVDLGKVKRKAVKKLKRGTGPLLREVDEAVATVERELGAEGEGKELVPVVLLYERKPKKRKRIFLW